MQILKDLRERASLTIRQVEEATGISNSYLSQLENGKIKKPSANYLYALSKLYSTSIEDLLIAAGIIKDSERVMPVIMKDSLEKRIEQLEKRVQSLEITSTVFGQ